MVKPQKPSKYPQQLKRQRPLHPPRHRPRLQVYPNPHTPLRLFVAQHERHVPDLGGIVKLQPNRLPDAHRRRRQSPVPREAGLHLADQIDVTLAVVDLRRTLRHNLELFVLCGQRFRRRYRRFQLDPKFAGGFTLKSSKIHVILLTLKTFQSSALTYLVAKLPAHVEPVPDEHVVRRAEQLVVQINIRKSVNPMER